MNDLGLRFDSHFKPHLPIEVGHIVNGNGVYSLMNHLMHVLLDPGEGIILSSPYYLGFDTMCTKRVDGVLVGVELDDLVNASAQDQEGLVDETIKRFEARLQESERIGVKVGRSPTSVSRRAMLFIVLLYVLGRRSRYCC